MDLIKTIEELRREKQKLERVIASLEELQAAMAGSPQKKRRGRRSMSHEERREVSERMKRYWADWHNKRRRRT
jgi:septal ring factor EnvC (AmiA/AmiB activator)